MTISYLSLYPLQKMLYDGDIDIQDILYEEEFKDNATDYRVINFIENNSDKIENVFDDAISNYKGSLSLSSRLSFLFSLLSGYAHIDCVKKVVSKNIHLLESIFEDMFYREEVLSAYICIDGFSEIVDRSIDKLDALISRNPRYAFNNVLKHLTSIPSVIDLIKRRLPTDLERYLVNYIDVPDLQDDILEIVNRSLSESTRMTLIYDIHLYIDLPGVKELLIDRYESYEKYILQNEFLEFLQDMPEIKKYNQNKNEK